MRALRSKNIDALAAILDDDVEVVEVLDAVPEAAAGFVADLIEKQRLATPYEASCAVPRQAAGEASSSAGAMADRAGVPLGAALGVFADIDGHGAFVAWLATLTNTFAALNGARRVGIRISHLRGPMCPRFHVDHVPSRVLVPLAGPGTEWIPDAAVRTEADGRIAQDPPAAAVQQLATGSIGLFKGAAFGDGDVRGVAHRSPPGDADRVLMTLDAIA